MARVVNALFWLLLVAFVLEFSLGVKISTIPGFSLKNIAIYGLIVALFFVNPTKNKPLIEKNKVNVPAILFIVYCIFSVIQTKMLNVVPGYSLVGELILLKSFMDPYVLFILTYSIVHDEKSAKRLLFALTALFATFLAITVFSSFGFIEVARVTIDAKYGRTRGAFSEPNQFAAYLVMFMPLVWVLIYAVKSKFLKMSLIGVIIISVYVLLLTGSRGGLVSLIVAVGIYYMLSSKQPFAKSMVKLAGIYSLILFVFVLVFFVLPDTTAAGLMSKLTGEFVEGSNTDYSSGRFGMWGRAMTAYIDSPIFGTGWNTFVPLFRGNSHSDYVLFLVTIGPVGLYLYMLVYVRMFKSVWLFRKLDHKYANFYNAYISGLAGFMTSMVFVNLMTPMYFTFLYSALIIKLGSIASKNLQSEVKEAVEKNKSLIGPESFSRVRLKKQKL